MSISSCVALALALVLALILAAAQPWSEVAVAASVLALDEAQAQELSYATQDSWHALQHCPYPCDWVGLMLNAHHR